MTKNSHGPQAASGVLLASLMLPGLAALSGLAPLNAAAENAPEKTTIGVKYGSYQDSQPGWDRVKVSAPQVYVQAPVAGEWSIEGSAVADSVSGASPRMHTQRSGASNMSDERRAGDLKVTRYLPRAAVSASVAYSDEHDYTSRAFGIDGRWSSEDNNRTWTLGYGTSIDRIDNTSNGVNTAINQRKRTHEIMAGVTQVLTPADIAQLNITRSTGHGYFNDPYKSFDQRPGERNAWIGLVRWNHYVEQFGAALRSSYRYYSDSFGVKSHTVGLDWVQPAGKWTLTPGVRYYTQSAAHFYLDPKFDAQGRYDMTATILGAIAVPGDKSFDQRLAAFGATTLSMKVAYAFTPDTSADIKVETYRQTSGMRLGGDGSPGLDPFRARFMQVGLTHRF
ncbi:MAG: DUF3570 domain-containing protein [Bacillota bacterium]